MKFFIQTKKYLSGIRLYLSAIFYCYSPSRLSKVNSLIRFRSDCTPEATFGEFNNKKVIFAPIYSFPDRVNVYEALLSRVFYSHGAEVSFVTCNSDLPMCAWNRDANNNNIIVGLHEPHGTKFLTKAKCNYCTSKFERFYGNSQDINSLKLSSYDGQNPLIDIPSLISKVDFTAKDHYYRGVNILEHARASALRGLLVGKLDLEQENHIALLKKYLYTTIYYLNKIEDLLIQEKPDVVCCVHGIYMEHGILVDLCKHLNLKIVISGIPYKKDCLWFGVGDTYHRTITYDDDYSWLNTELTQEKINKTLSYIKSKQTGGRDNISFHPNPKTDKRAIRAELGLDDSDRIVSIFTNTLWDAQVAYKENAFENMMDWLVTTIIKAAELPKYKFIIRVHPGESKIGLNTNQPIILEIYKHFPSLPDNIILVGPDSDISSVDLGIMSELSVIYGSKIGIELAVLGKLVVVAGEAICRNKGFTTDILNKKQYLALLNNIDAALVEFDPNNTKSLCLKWAHHLFFEIMIYFPWATADPVRGKNSLVYMPTDEREYDYVKDVCRQILSAEKIIAPPNFNFE